MIYWQAHKFSGLNYEHVLRLMVPSATALVASCQLVLGTFSLSILGIRQIRHTAVGDEAIIKASDELSVARNTPSFNLFKYCFRFLFAYLTDIRWHWVAWCQAVGGSFRQARPGPAG